MSNTKNVGAKDGGQASAINVVLTTLKTTTASTSSGDGLRFQSSPISLFGGGEGGGTEKLQKFCCDCLFPTVNSYLLHLAEKAPKDVVHEMRLIEMGMLRCAVCSVWVHRDSMPVHLKKSHGMVNVAKNSKVVSTLSRHPSNENNASEAPLKTGKSYVIKVSGQTLAAGKSFMVSCPSSKLENSIDGAATSVVSKPSLKLITTTSGSLYPKIHLQQANSSSTGKVMVRQSLPNTPLPVVTFGSRVIMKSATKVSGVKTGVSVASSGIRKLVPVTSNNVMEKAAKTVNGVTTLQVGGSTVMASSSSDSVVKRDTNSNKGKAKQKLKLNLKSVSKGNKVVSKIENKLKSTKKHSGMVSTGNSVLSSSVDSRCETSTHVKSLLSDGLDSNTKESKDVKYKLIFNKKSVASAKFEALRFSYSEDTTENLNKNEEKTEMALTARSNSLKGKGKQKNKASGTNGKVKIVCKGNELSKSKGKTESQLDLLAKQQEQVSSVSKDDSLLCANSSSVFSDEKCDPKRETEGLKAATGKKRRKQVLKPVKEPDGDPIMNVPITSKVKVRKRRKKESLNDESDSGAFAKNVVANSVANKKKCGKPLKENKSDIYRPTPKTSHPGSRGGRGGWRKRGPGRPRKDSFVKPASPDLSELDSLFGEGDNEDIENEPFLVSKVREDDNIPTVELDLFTLPSLDEQASVLLTDPHNPDFKVYASMDAIFVGDSALGDVTNQIGYVTDANNVVFVNPSHFLFPNIQELDKFVPSPIVTMKEKIGHSPKKICKLSTSNNHTKVICMDKRLMKKSFEDSRDSSKHKSLSGNQESQENEKKQSKARSGGYSTKGTVVEVKSSAESRVRRRSARLSGDQDDALQVPLHLKKGELVSKVKKTSKGALCADANLKNVPFKLKIPSVGVRKDNAISTSLDSELYSLGTGGKELKVMISPLKLEHQSLVEEFLLENRKSPTKSRLSLSFNDGSLNKCQEGRKKLGAQLVSKDVKCDTLAATGVCEKETLCSKRQRTRTRSADSAYSVKNANLDTVSSGKSNDNNYLSKRKGRLKSESELMANSNPMVKESKICGSAQDQRQSNQECEDVHRVLRTRLRHYSNDRELPKISKTSSDLITNNSGSGNVSEIDQEETKTSVENVECQITEAVPEKTQESDGKESLEALPENSLIKGKNWNISNNVARHLCRNRPVRERRPSSKWLESIAYGMHFRKVSSPMLRTTRSVSDTTDQVSCENLESVCRVDERDAVMLPVSPLNQSKPDSESEVNQGSLQEESNDKETALCISEEAGIQQETDDNNRDQVKENIEGINQVMYSEAMKDPSEKLKEIDKVNHHCDEEAVDCKTPSNSCEEEDPMISCENKNYVTVEQSQTDRSENSDYEEEATEKQIATGTVTENIVAMSENKSLNEGRSEIIKLSSDKNSFIYSENPKPNEVSVENVKKGGLKSKKTKLILKKVEENFDAILKESGSVSDEAVVNNRNGMMTSIWSSDAGGTDMEECYSHMTPELSSNELDIINSDLKQDMIKNEDIVVGLNDGCIVNETAEVKEAEVEANDKSMGLQVNENEAQKDECKIASKVEEVKIQDKEVKIMKTGLPENLEDTVDNSMLIKAVEGTNEVVEDASNETQNMGKVFGIKSKKAVLDEMPSETVKSADSETMERSDVCCPKILSEPQVEVFDGKVNRARARKVKKSNLKTKTVKRVRETMKDSQSIDKVALSELKTGSGTVQMNTESNRNISTVDIANENVAVKCEKESLPLKSISRVSALLIEVSESLKVEETAKSPPKVEGQRSSKKLSSSPSLRKGCPDGSPPREWLGRGAKLKAQVLIQDQQTGVTDSHIVASSHIYSPDKRKSSSPKSEKLISSPCDPVVSSKTSGGSSKNVKSPKSPRICYEEREWQARGAKLKAQVMITDQQTGQTNTRVETLETMHSPRSSFTSPPSKKIKFESPPGSMKDIRSFFTLYKSPERGITKPESKSEIVSSSSSSSQLSSPSPISPKQVDPPSISSSTKCSPKSISSSPRPSPHSNKRRKVKLYTVTSSDIRNFFSPVSGTKRKVESGEIPDISKSIKIEEDVSPVNMTEIKDSGGNHLEHENHQSSENPDSLQENSKINKTFDDIWNIHPLEENCSEPSGVKDICSQQENCKTEKTVDSCRSVPELPSSTLDFEGFKLSSRSSDVRAKSLVRLVSHLENKAWYGLGNFPLPVDHLCDWNDDWLNIKIFDKHL